jgi:hypothetical protein
MAKRPENSKPVARTSEAQISSHSKKAFSDFFIKSSDELKSSHVNVNRPLIS